MGEKIGEYVYVERMYGPWYNTSVHSYVRLKSGGMAILPGIMALMLPALVRGAAGLSGSQVKFPT